VHGGLADGVDIVEIDVRGRTDAGNGHLARTVSR
jgi:hypothetical protein